MFKRSFLAILILLVSANLAISNGKSSDSGKSSENDKAKTNKNAPKPGTYYKLSELGIRKTEIVGSKLKLTFRPKDEQFYWCPGAKVEAVKHVTVVTFVRCKTSKSWSVDAKAAIGKGLVRTITIDTGNKDTYVRDGAKRLKRIFEAPDKAPKDVKKAGPKKVLPPDKKEARLNSIEPELIKNTFTRPAG